MVVQGHVTHERLLQILTTGESMRFEHISNAPIETRKQADTHCNLFELFAVFVLAIVNSMDQIVHQRVQNMDGVTKVRGNEDLISFIGAAAA